MKNLERNVKKQIEKLVKVLSICGNAINSADPSSVDSVIDDNSLIERTCSIVKSITGVAPDQVSVLEALNGIRFFSGSYKDGKETYELKFISMPMAVVMIKSNSDKIIYTKCGRVQNVD